MCTCVKNAVCDPDHSEKEVLSGWYCAHGQERQNGNCITETFHVHLRFILCSKYRDTLYMIIEANYL